jgi:hypothetical protein
VADSASTDRVGPRGGEGRDRRARGGLRVEYRNLGEEEERGRYDAGEKVVLINLDHPMVAAARDALGIEDQGFVRLSYEIAFTTYALGLAREVLAKDPELSGTTSCSRSATPFVASCGVLRSCIGRQSRDPGPRANTRSCPRKVVPFGVCVTSPSRT